MSEFIPPKLGEDGFNCPNCGAYAAQEWGTVQRRWNGGYSQDLKGWAAAQCQRCGDPNLWLGETLVWPRSSVAPRPNADLPADVLALYQEASTIASDSPRAAAALLRLALDSLVVQIGGAGSKLDDRIGSLAKKGLPERVIRAMDVVRIAGNNAVHPGEIELHDDAETVGKMFVFLNMVADYTLTKEREVTALFEKMPEGAKKAVEKRDGKR